MARAGLDKEIVIKRTAQLANEIGIENITLKILADDLKVQPPSLYNSNFPYVKWDSYLEKSIL